MTIRRATLADLDQLSTTLAQAFDDDAVMHWIMRRDEHRGPALRQAIRFLAEHVYLPNQEVYLAADGTGATMWQPPGKDPSLGLRASLRLLRIMRRGSGWLGLPRLARSFFLIDSLHPKTAHIYLFCHRH